MKKGMILAVVLSAFLSIGTLGGVAMADQLKIVSYDGTTAWRGQINFETVPPNQFEWGYCTEESITSYTQSFYDYTLNPITGYFAPKPNYGLIAADLIWEQYKDGNVTSAEKTALQSAIWAIWSNDALYNSYQFKNDTALLESLFSIAYVVNSSGIGQDFIVYDPVPEPVSMLLFGTGLIGVGGYLRRKLKK